MSGSYGESPYGSEPLPWRAIVEATSNVSASGDGANVGGSEAQTVVSASQDGVVSPASRAITTAVAAMPEDGNVAASAAAVGHAGSLTSAAGDIEAPGVGVVESSADFTAGGDIESVSVAVGSARASMSADADPAGVGGSISQGVSAITAFVDTSHIVAASTESPPLLDPQPPGLLPLDVSAERDEIETELKQLFMLLFETYIRPDERFVNVLGAPQLGPRELIESSLASDGLSIYRGASVALGAGNYLLRSWRAMNPKRGLHLLKTYLQLLWPNVWTATQMWQEKGEDYPEALTETDEGNHYLTSRVNVTLPARATTGGDVSAISSGLRASLPARMVLNLSISSDEEFSMGIASVYYKGLVAQHYEGTFN